MARNEEKNYTILNRLYLEKQAELSKDKNPERPHLNSLSTASEVKKWIPGIKWEINFCLHHLSGIRNYPDYKIREFEERLEQLRGEYKRWVKRALELDPDTPGIPGDPHVYVSKKTINDIKQRKQIVREMNPNGYTKLYTRSINLFRLPKQDEPEVQYDDEGYAREGEEDITYASAAGTASDLVQLNNDEHQASAEFQQVLSYHQQWQAYHEMMMKQQQEEDADNFVTPLAARPDGYVSDEDKKSTTPSGPDPNDPQNQPLAFSKKRAPEEFSYKYTNKRPNTVSDKPQETTEKPKDKPTGLGLVAYDSDDSE